MFVPEGMRRSQRPLTHSDGCFHLGPLNHHLHFLTGLESEPIIHCSGDVIKGSNLCIAMVIPCKGQHHLGYHKDTIGVVILDSPFEGKPTGQGKSEHACVWGANIMRNYSVSFECGQLQRLKPATLIPCIAKFCNQKILQIAFKMGRQKFARRKFCKRAYVNEPR